MKTEAKESKDKSITPFSNASEFMLFEDHCCSCKKYTDPSMNEFKCDIRKACFDGMSMDDVFTEDILQRMGYYDRLDVTYIPDCKEWETKK